MSTDLIQIKEKEYYKSYKELIVLCLNNGEVLPVLLDMINVPDKYQFSEKEIENMKISDESSRKRQDTIMENEANLAEMMEEFKDTLTSDEILNTFYNQELMDFIARYPKYQKLLK